MKYDAPSPTNPNEVPQVLVDYYKVDRPWPLSYLAWLFDPTKTTEMNQNRKIVPVGVDISIGEWQLRGSGILTGDFGRVGDLTSYDGQVKRGPTVTTKIEEGWGNSVLLVGLAVLFSILLGIPLGIWMSSRQGGRVDRAVTFVSSLTLSLPLYGLAYVLITFLAVLPYYLYSQQGWSWLPRLPAGSTHSSDPVGNVLLDHLYHVLLPALVLAIPQIAIISKYVRASMLEVLGLDYIRTAWAKGLPRWRILAKHAFRNALLPTITVIGLVLPGIASGLIVIEYAFAYQGLGYLTFTALGGCVPTDDNPCNSGTGQGMEGTTLMALLVILVAVIAIANMLADIMYMVADPRIRYTSGRDGT
jgi:peptide/nickel transport system permease protein